MKPEELSELHYLIHKQVGDSHRLELSACQGKVRYATRTDALRGIRPHKRGMVGVYRCRVCAGWHVGQRLRLKRLAEERTRCVSR